VLVLQALYNLSDDQAEFQIRDRLSFMRFSGLSPGVQSPDAKTIWLFREQLVEVRSAVDPSTSSGGLCRAEAPHGPVHPHHRYRTREDENRHACPDLRRRSRPCL
jgi:Transposase domain (DUF772)